VQFGGEIILSDLRLQEMLLGSSCFSLADFAASRSTALAPAGLEFLNHSLQRNQQWTTDGEHAQKKRFTDCCGPLVVFGRRGVLVFRFV
jgi:hypothetical protein